MQKISAKTEEYRTLELTFQGSIKSINTYGRRDIRRVDVCFGTSQKNGQIVGY
jgi:hypothetical protein